MNAQTQLLNQAREGNEAAFRNLVEAHRRGLLAHCYRMAGSLQDAEDVSQEALLRAWRGLGGFEQRSSFRNWLYRIATHASLDAIKKGRRRLLPPASHAPAEPLAPLSPPEALWLEPYPDALLPDPTPGAEAVMSQRQSVAFAFLQALQQLPASQRAALLLKDVIGLSAGEIADVLDTSVASVNSLLQRAREKLGNSAEPTVVADSHQEEQVTRYMQAWNSSDVGALVGLLRNEARLSMPPTPSWYQGPDAIGAFLQHAVLPPGSADMFRTAATRANGMPALAMYQRQADGTYALMGVQVIDVRVDGIEEIVTFMDPAQLRFFDLPPTLPC